MRKIYITLVLLSLFIFNCIGQDLNNNRFGITFTTLQSKCYKYKNFFEEDIAYDGQKGYNLGFKYLRFINQRFQIEAGINYSKIYIYLTKDVELDHPYQSRREQRNIISFPISIVTNITNGFFISSGIHLDLEVNQWSRLKVNDQDGLGFNLSFGKMFHLSENIYFTVAPIVKAHAIVPFNKVHSHQRIFDYGIKFDLTYGFLK